MIVLPSKPAGSLGRETKEHKKANQELKIIALIKTQKILMIIFSYFCSQYYIL